MFFASFAGNDAWGKIWHKARDKSRNKTRNSCRGKGANEAWSFIIAGALAGVRTAALYGAIDVVGAGSAADIRDEDSPEENALDQHVPRGDLPCGGISCGGFTPKDIEQIIARNASAVYKLAFARCGNRADADDIFQQVFLRYIARRPEFANAAHEKAWFLRVTVNCSKNFWGSAFRRNTQPMTEEITAPQPEDHGLEAAVAALPEKYRVLIHLFYYEGMTTADIAQLLGRKESTVRMQLTRARRLLGESLKGDANEIEF